jgi:hypothetical protein
MSVNLVFEMQNGAAACQRGFATAPVVFLRIYSIDAGAGAGWI